MANGSASQAILNNGENSGAVKALALATQLAETLQLEFEALQQQNLEHFEQLQAGKTELLAQIASLCPPSDVMQREPPWQGLLNQMSHCRDLHRRNAVLIERKLEAIRGALQSLQSAAAPSSVEVYDRMGQVARFSRGRGYQDA